MKDDGQHNVNADQRRDLAKIHGSAIDRVIFRPGGISCDIYLDKDEMMFSAHIGGTSFKSKNGSEVRSWALDVLTKSTKLTWYPVISVLDVGEGGRNYTYGRRKLSLHEISIDIYRFHVAWLPNGGMRSVEWDTPEDARVACRTGPSIWVSREDKLVIKDGAVVALHDDHVHILPYSDAMWAGLIKLCEGIDALRGKLHNLLMEKEGLLKLQDIGANFLHLIEDTKK